MAKKSYKRTTKTKRAKAATGGTRKRVRKTAGAKTLQQTVGVSAALWKTMTAAERLAIVVKARDAEIIRLGNAINKALLQGRKVDELYSQRHRLQSQEWMTAATHSANTGRF